MRCVALSLCLLATGLLACGGEDGGRPSEQPPSDDATAVARVANQYVVALAAKDWAAVCQTRSHAERVEHARIAGSCVQAFRTIGRALKGNPTTSMLEQARARAPEIKIRGNRARVPMFRPGEKKLALDLRAQREKGRWVLVSETRPTPVPNAAKVERPSGRDAAALVRLANDYLLAFVTKDWRTACRIRPRPLAEPRRLPSDDDACVQDLERLERSGRSDTSGFAMRRARARAANIEVRRNRARVPIFQPGQDRPATVLLAQRERGRWRLVSVPKAQHPAFLRGE